MKNINKLIFLILLTILPNVVFAASYTSGEAKVVYIIGVALMAIRIAVPILLIVMSSIDLIKALIESDAKDVRKTLIGVGPKVVSAIIIFILPSFLLFILKLTNKNTLMTQYSTCLLSPSLCETALWTEPPVLTNTSPETPTVIYSGEDSGDKGKLEIVSITLLDTVVNVKAQRGSSRIAGYYFSSIEKTPDLNGYDWIETNSETFKTVKYPGTYYIYVKDEAGNISEPKKVNVTTDFDVTKGYKGFKPMGSLTIANYLKKHNSNIDELNKKLATYNVKHGMRTRESVVVGAMAFISELHSWGYYLPYGGVGGDFEKDKWGVNKFWGPKFMACDPYVAWSYRNAGLNIYVDRLAIKKFTPYTYEVLNKKTGEKLKMKYAAVNAEGYSNSINVYYFFVGVTGSKTTYGDNIKPRQYGLPGDVLQNKVPSAHEMLIVDKYDDDMDGVSDGYIVLQSKDGGLCYENRPYSEGIVVYDMTNVFNNTAGFAQYLEPWKQYYIPTSDYPNYLKELLTQK